jgi:hypothetical protein
MCFTKLLASGCVENISLLVVVWMHFDEKCRFLRF